MGETRERLSNDELAFFENNIAAAIHIIYASYAIVNLTDDTDVLEFAQRIMLEADDLRCALIHEMRQRKKIKPAVEAAGRRKEPGRSAKARP